MNCSRTRPGIVSVGGGVVDGFGAGRRVDLTSIVFNPEYDRQFRVDAPGAPLGNLLQGLRCGPIILGNMQQL